MQTFLFLAIVGAVLIGALGVFGSAIEIVTLTLIVALIVASLIWRELNESKQAARIRAKESEQWNSGDITPEMMKAKALGMSLDYYRAKQSPESPVKCPKCGSTQITADKKGFGLGKAVVGGATLGVPGLLGGFVGSRKVQITCLKCGKTWAAGSN